MGSVARLGQISRLIWQTCLKCGLFVEHFKKICLTPSQTKRPINIWSESGPLTLEVPPQWLVIYFVNRFIRSVFRLNPLPTSHVSNVSEFLVSCCTNCIKSYCFKSLLCVIAQLVHKAFLKVTDPDCLNVSHLNCSGKFRLSFGSLVALRSKQEPRFQFRCVTIKLRLISIKNQRRVCHWQGLFPVFSKALSLLASSLRGRPTDWLQMVQLRRAQCMSAGPSSTFLWLPSHTWQYCILNENPAKKKSMEMKRKAAKTLHLYTQLTYLFFTQIFKIQVLLKSQKWKKQNKIEYKTC